MNKFFKQLIEFIEKHSKFFKKLLIFTIIYFVLCIVNNSSLLVWVETLFGECMSTALQAIVPTFLISSEV